jgi:acyl carrier protein
MATESEVRGAIASFLKLAPERVTSDAVMRDLVSESFVLVELVMELQEQFTARLTGEDLARIKTAGELSTLVAERAEA